MHCQPFCSSEACSLRVQAELDWIQWQHRHTLGTTSPSEYVVYGQECCRKLDIIDQQPPQQNWSASGLHSAQLSMGRSSPPSAYHTCAGRVCLRPLASGKTGSVPAAGQYEPLTAAVGHHWLEHSTREHDDPISECGRCTAVHNWARETRTDIKVW